MLKRLILLFTAFCLLLSLAACGKHDAQKESRPENWDVEAEVLRYCNGFYRAKTAEDLKSYVTSETTDTRIKEFVNELNASMSGLTDTLDYRDYPYDSVEVTYLDTYEGFEIFWAKPTSSAFEAAAEELRKNTHGMVSYSNIGPGLLMVLTIENGHYVSSLDEGLSNEVLKKYDYCQSCHGQGGFAYLGWECSACNGEGTQTAYLCQDCNTVNIPGLMPFPGGNADGIQTNLSSLTSVSLGGLRAQCTQCGGSNFVETQIDCSNCLGSGGEEGKFESCATCSGKGWIKK